MKSKTTRVFVDQVDEGIATIIISEQTARVPVSLLAAGAGEGQWIEIAIRLVPVPREHARGRRRR